MVSLVVALEEEGLHVVEEEEDVAEALDSHLTLHTLGPLHQPLNSLATVCVNRPATYTHTP